MSPITGTFTHTSNDVWELIFDNADTVRVTAAHPFYSLDAQDWRLAGELRLGERVQSKDNQGILTGASYLPGKHKVYNLEVRTNHNFLVGNSGLLVHNQCKVSELRELVQALKKDPDWVLPLSPGSNVLDKNPDWLTELAKLPDQLPVTNTGPSLQRFIDDVGDAAGNIRGELVRAWEAFFPDELIRKNTTWLQKLVDYLTISPNKLDEVTDMFAIEKGKNRVTAYLRGLLERKHFDGTVYRGDLASVTPTQAFNNGIPSKGAHDNLIKHLDGGSTNKGDFVSSSKDISIANDFASDNGYVFKVRSRNGKGIDVNETLGDEIDNWFPEQLEVSMLGGIDKADIIGAYPKGQLTQADFIPNPNYIP